MNKVGIVTVCGIKYKACLSTRVLIALEDKSNRSAQDELERILNAGKMKDLFWLLAEMMNAGYVYSKKMFPEEDIPKPPTYDELVDGTLITDYAEMFAQLKLAVKESSKSDVEIQNEKKASAIQEG